MAWWDKHSEIPYQSKNFQKIINFYLFNCPVIFPQKKSSKRVSQRGLSFEERGITDSRLRKLLSEMKNASASGALMYRAVDVAQSDNFTQIEQSYNADDLNFEMVLFIENSGLKKTKTIFYAIRNALAHGSFSVSGTGQKRIYCLENRKDNMLKARIRLREKTLLKWIKLVEKPESWKKQKSKKKSKEKILALA